MTHTTFVSTSRTLRRDTPPMVLFEKAKRLGIWNPSDIDLTQDAKDWHRLTDIQQHAMLQLTSLFQAGEEAVTLDLLPLIDVIAREGRLEEELFLTTFLFEEAKHTDFFNRWVSEVAPDAGDLSRFHGPNYRALFYEALPAALNRLRDDPSPAALTRASTTYNLVVEGIIAETGYHAYFLSLDKLQVMPGTRRGITLLKQDEARHIAYGIYLISRLMAEDPDLWEVVEETMNELLGLTLAMIEETYVHYKEPPFGIGREVFNEFAMRQFQKRLDRINRARGMSMEEVCLVTQTAIDEDDA